MQLIAATAPVSPQAHITIQLEPGGESSDDAKDEIQPLVQEGDDWVVASDTEPDAVIDVDQEGQTDAGAEPDDRGATPPPLPPAAQCRRLAD